MRISVIKALVTIKNGCRLRKTFVNLKFSTSYIKILKILYREGFIQSFHVDFLNFQIVVYLRFFHNKNALTDIKFFSVPSHQKFISFFDLSRISSKKTFILLSTHKGLLNLSECKKYKIGGKLLFSI